MTLANEISAEQQKKTVIRIVARKDEWPIQFVKWGRELAKDPSNTHLINALKWLTDPPVPFIHGGCSVAFANESPS
jgi:hypothetical protein